MYKIVIVFLLFFKYRDSFCVEPPCGQLNPMVEEMYTILDQIFQEYYELFEFDSFHYGGDEVFFICKSGIAQPLKFCV